MTNQQCDMLTIVKTTQQTSNGCTNNNRSNMMNQQNANLKKKNDN